MSKNASVDPMAIVASRVVDLRAEFEAQLRAVSRLEEQLRKTRIGKDADRRTLEEVLGRELTEMLTNNRNIHDVLEQLAADTQRPATPPL